MIFDNYYSFDVRRRIIRVGKYILILPMRWMSEKWAWKGIVIGKSYEWYLNIPLWGRRR